MAYRNNTTLSKYLQPGRIVTLVCHSLVKWGHIWRALILLIHSSPGNVQIKINDDFKEILWIIVANWAMKLPAIKVEGLKFLLCLPESRIVKVQFLQAFNFDSWQLAALLASVSFLKVLINNDLRFLFKTQELSSIFNVSTHPWLYEQ